VLSASGGVMFGQFEGHYLVSLASGDSIALQSQNRVCSWGVLHAYRTTKPAFSLILQGNRRAAPP
jgi:hypothetical protein